MLSCSSDSAIFTVFEPKITQRVGVRYIDRIWREGSRKPADWKGLLDGSVLGLAGVPALENSVIACQTYSELAVGDYRANVRGSLATDNIPTKFSMVLDTDCFDERSRLFELDAIQNTIDELHILNLQLFQQVITEQFFEELRG